VRRVAAALLLAAVLLAPPAEAATRWGWLGVRIRDLSEQEMEEISQRFGLREGFGAVIVEVIKETPATWWWPSATGRWWIPEACSAPSPPPRWARA
jgi:hypothetical protein